MFKLNINAIIFAYMLDSLSLWHIRLCHISTKKINYMVKSNLIPKYEIDMIDKYKFCMQTKITRMSVLKVERTSSLLELIHNNVCDFQSTPTREGKKYFATFIDDYSKFFYVYLLYSKDEI